jgi:hypothetical protein
MRRRDFVTLLGGVAAWPLAASAQQKPVSGFLNSGSAEAYSDRLTAFHQGLRQLGYVVGRHEARFAGSRRCSGCLLRIDNATTAGLDT